MTAWVCRAIVPPIVSMLVLASASAGASTARPPVALTVTPARVEIQGAGSATLRVTNASRGRVALNMGRAGFALDLRGRPRVVARGSTGRSAAGWLTVRPRNLALRPGTAGTVRIASRLPRGAEPGDHDALVLITSRRRASDGLAVRVRMGVIVVVRAPGTVVRRLVVRGLRVARRDRARTLELTIENRGNVTESFSGSRARIWLFRGARRVAVLRGVPREIRPRTRGVLEFRSRAALVGPFLARVHVVSESGRVTERTFRLRL